MKLFRCTCNSKPVLYFENVQCESCGRLTGFCQDSFELKPFTPIKAKPKTKGARASKKIVHRRATVWEDDTGRQYTKCANWRDHNICNWMLPIQTHTSTQSLCSACVLNDVTPEPLNTETIKLWHKLEKAKKRCLFTLLQLQLPVHAEPIADGKSAPHKLAFRFMSDSDASSHFQEPIEGAERVLTGHANGIITINVAEADDVARTQNRVAMQERYRTLLGHFRHETGHYFWDVLTLADTNFTESFREVFGDENASYQEALDRHYADGPPTDWQNTFVSSYATMHPWEDWAETWAHYLHMIDTIETQQSFSRNSQTSTNPVRDVSLPFAVGARGDKGEADFTEIMELWIDASILLNSLNRSMGLPDPYPFVLHQPIQEKLRFVHDRIRRLGNLATNN